MGKFGITAASAQYIKAWNGYKKRLKDNPNLSLKAHCDEVGMDYRHMIGWTSRHRLYVSSLKSGNANYDVSFGGSDNPAFVQFVPRQSIQPSSSLLRGVSITFPDGVNLTLQESNTESVISLLTIYQQRKAAMSATTVAAQGGAE